MDTYEICKSVIFNQKSKGSLNAEDMLSKLDIFLLGGRLSGEQYNELVAIVNEQLQ